MKNLMFALVCALLLAVGAIAAACGDDGGAGSPAVTEETSTEEDAGAAETAAPRQPESTAGAMAMGGGSQRMAADAMHWGTATKATVIPAPRSERMLQRPAIDHLLDLTDRNCKSRRSGQSAAGRGIESPLSSKYQGMSVSRPILGTGRAFFCSSARLTWRRSAPTLRMCAWSRSHRSTARHRWH